MSLPINPLGDLEKAVLEDLWRHKAGDVKEVYGRVGVPRSISLNTVQSTLQRLHRKALLDREKISHAYVYTLGVQRAELVGAMISNLIASLGPNSTAPVLAAFVEFAARQDPSNLDYIVELIAARRSAGLQQA